MYRSFSFSPVGVFDSGVGGLTVLKECVSLMPWQKFIYFGDNPSAPYGDRPEEEIVALATRAMNLFTLYNVRAAVVACNTVTCTCISLLRQKFPFPIVGTEPALLMAKGCKRPLILGTAATLKSPRFLYLLEKLKSYGASPKVVCPHDWVDEIEKSRQIVDNFGIDDHIFPQGVDGVVLGCTHYVFLRKIIQKRYPNLPIFDGNAAIAKRLKSLIYPPKSGDNSVVINNLSTTLITDRVTFVGKGKVVNEYLCKQMFT